MISFDLETLRSIGLQAADAEQALNLPQPVDDAAGIDLQLLRLTAVHRDRLQVHDGIHETTARLWPRLARRLFDDGSALAVGDWVLASSDEGGQCWVRHRLAPRTHLVRRDGEGRRHVVASNVDVALLVMGLDDDFNLRRLERFVALVDGAGVTPVVVLTKADTVVDAADLANREQLVRDRTAERMQLFSIDARGPEAARCLQPLLSAGRTLVLLGSSGAGKSTLANTLLGTALQDTGPVRDHDSRGKHTTTARSLLRLPGGACIIDTPGVRTLQPDADAATIAASFGEIGRFARQCRFRNCRHTGEPGCAVREAVPTDRLDNYQKMLREASRDTMSALERRQQLSIWKARGRASRERLRVKRGETRS